MVFTTSLKQNHLFRRLYQRGFSAKSNYCVIYCRQNGLEGNRLGLTASTKLGHAVVRNRLRRRFREIYRLNEAKLVTGYDLVIVARHGAIDADFSLLERNVLELLKKLRLIRKEYLLEEAALDPHTILPD